MESSNLKLIFLKGPQKGESVDFKSRTSIRVGRLVRGNNVVIKDPGISSHHLLIEFKSGKWMVEDLDSSNGTGLNSSPITSFEASELRDKDIINLGETTSLLVEIGTVVESPYGRGKRTRARAKGSVSTSQEDTLSKGNVKSIVKASRKTKSVKSKGVGTSGRAKRTRTNNQVLQLETLNEEEEDEREVNQVAEPILNDEVNQEAEPILIDSLVKEEEQDMENDPPREQNARLNWDKLTLGEWFDFMEEYLRKQVIEMNEAVIEDMKQRAERVCEHIRKHGENKA